MKNQLQNMIKQLNQIQIMMITIIVKVEIYKQLNQDKHYTIQRNMKNQLQNLIKQLNQIQIMMITIIDKGQALQNLKKYEESIIEFDKAIELNPNDDDYYNCKG
ncbi:unnamed protein product (macronuclear) [Paramecium tetraurelia]|uniref:Uncharacterized protein n=1 Tax=Paramecium tetraurelia TaxID=5888 RepID=A0BP11_PARTE|nr:uncharacterized protein GSPATT00030917001 [Paramecium tetraurelia]CAK60278.1 unnamed protein product [Paramecium tetraurelia]|eukprot:XP_001427676.1 hypothetical protein (macronuclear) [Paramecium tetraurelia strain d4-2]